MGIKKLCTRCDERIGMLRCYRCGEYHCHKCIIENLGDDELKIICIDCNELNKLTIPEVYV